MEKHLTLVSVLNIVYRFWTALCGILLMVLGAGFEEFMRFLGREFHVRLYEIPNIVFEIAPIILLATGGLILVLSAAGIAGAVGVLKRREWGRILLLVVSCFSLLRLPLGTLLGGYSIWVLMKDESIRLFRPAA